VLLLDDEVDADDCIMAGSDFADSSRDLEEEEEEAFSDMT
jgi:hypothetical protein